MNSSSIAEMIPAPHFREFHYIGTSASVENCWEGLKSLDINQSKLIKFLFFLRGLSHLKNTKTILNGWSDSWNGFFNAGFKPVAINPPRSFVIMLNLNHFTSKKNQTKIGWDFQIRPTKQGCVISTETRVYFESPRLKRLFWPYWLIIRIPSGTIRYEMLRLIRDFAIKGN